MGLCGLPLDLDLSVMRADVVIDLLIAAVIWGSMYMWIGRFTLLQWKQGVRGVVFLAVSALLSYFVGHWSLVFIIGHPLLGLLIHVLWCRSHGLHWVRFDPEAYRASEREWLDKLERRSRRAGSSPAES